MNRFTVGCWRRAAGAGLSSRRAPMAPARSAGGSRHHGACAARRARSAAASVTVLDAEHAAGRGRAALRRRAGAGAGPRAAAAAHRGRAISSCAASARLEQYQGAPNPSVGFLIDDIDFSGVGMPATLFDVDRHRGAARAAGHGLRRQRARGPDQRAHARSRGRASSSAARPRAVTTARVAGGVAVGDASTAAGRLARGRAAVTAATASAATPACTATTPMASMKATLRGKLRWQSGAGLRLNATLMHVDLDNGYDAWSIDNTRVTRSDQPGRDAQRSDGAALRCRAANRGRRAACADFGCRLAHRLLLRRRLGQRGAVERRGTLGC